MTPEVKTEIEVLWRQGKLSGRQIALRLGITKDAVYGHVHRCKLPLRPVPKALRGYKRVSTWTTEELMLLRRLRQATVRIKMLPRYFPRHTYHAICYQLRRPGFARSPCAIQEPEDVT